MCIAFAKIRIELCYADLILPAIMVYGGLQHCLLNLTQYTTTFYIECLIFCVTFIVYRNLAKQNKRLSIESLFAILLLSNITEYVRLYVSDLNIEETVTNHWGNSGIFALFLAICCTIIVAYCNRHSNKYIKAMLILLFVIDLITTIYLQSRLSLVIIIMLFLYTLHKKYKFLKKHHLVVICAVLLLIVAVAFKRDSSIGRFLIIKITYEMITNHPLLGVGYGNFAAEFPNYQAKYYADGKMTDNEMMMADNTVTTLNEPLQMVCELGLFGIAMLTIIAITVIKQLLNNSKEFILIIGAIVISLFFSYILHITFFKYAVAFLSGIYCTNIKPLICVNSMYLIPISIALVCCTGYLYPKYIAISKMESSNKSFFLRGFNKHLSDNHVYRYSYAGYLLNNGKTDEAFILLQKLKKYVLWYTPLVIEGDYYSLKQIPDSAEQAYLLAKNIYPAKFTARHKLFNLYQQTNSHDKTKREAKEIVRLKEKVPSPKTMAIILNAK